MCGRPRALPSAIFGACPERACACSQRLEVDGIKRMKRVSQRKWRRSQAISRRYHPFRVDSFFIWRRFVGGVRRPWAETTLLRRRLSSSNSTFWLMEG